MTDEKLCPNCGASPCYMLCPNHPEYYSAEQERADDERYEAMSYGELVMASAAVYHSMGLPDPWDIYDSPDASGDLDSFDPRDQDEFSHGLGEVLAVGGDEYEASDDDLPF